MNLGVFMMIIVTAIIVTIIFRRKILAKSPIRLKKFLLKIPRIFIWNGVIRSMLELFYPKLLLAMTTVSKNIHEKSKLTIPFVQIWIFVSFFFVTATHIEHNKEFIDQD